MIKSSFHHFLFLLPYIGEITIIKSRALALWHPQSACSVYNFHGNLPNEGCVISFLSKPVSLSISEKDKLLTSIRVFSLTGRLFSVRNAFSIVQIIVFTGSQRVTWRSQENQRAVVYLSRNKFIYDKGLQRLACRKVVNSYICLHSTVKNNRSYA